MPRPKFIKFPVSKRAERKYGARVFVPESQKSVLKRIIEGFPSDHVRLVQAGQRQVVVRAEPLDVKEILKLQAFQSKGCTYYRIWFKNSGGKPFERACVLRIGGKFYYTDYKYSRLGIEKTAGPVKTLVDKFAK